MAGYREFRQGEIWFYYNPNVSKDLERRKELGAVTSRPVVIIQDAYYPEWNDCITVVPMTSSDRRSGIPIDTTILSDGALIEGGTILPYCLYTVKTKYLHPMTTDGRGVKLHCLSLAPDDFEAILNGVKFHLGLSKEVPEYVKNWKTLDDYERNVILKTVHIAVEDFEKHVSSCPRLIQIPTESTAVENHVIAAFDKMDPTHSTFDLTSTELSTDGEESKIYKESGDVKKVCLFKKVEVDDFLVLLDDYLGGAVPADDIGHGRLYPGSLLLAEVPYNQVDTVLTPEEMSKLCNMTINEIMENAGVKSKTSASRVRKYLRDLNPDAIEESTGMRYVQPFIYTTGGAINRPRLKRNARRRKVLFSYPQEELVKMIDMDISELQHIIPTLAASSLRQLQVDIGYMYPDATVKIEGEDVPVSVIQDDLEAQAQEELDKELATSYEFWETLSRSEIAEIASVSKRNAGNAAKKYGLTKPNLTTMKNIAIELSRKGGARRQPPIDETRTKIAVLNVIHDMKFREVSITDMLIYCRTDHTIIMECYGEVKSPNTPSKNDIAQIKRTIRHIIVKRPKR